MKSHFLDRSHFLLSAGALGLSACAGRSLVPRSESDSSSLRGALDVTPTPTPMATSLDSGVDLTISADGQASLTYNGGTLAAMSYVDNTLTVQANGQTQTFDGPSPSPEAAVSGRSTLSGATTSNFERITVDKARKRILFRDAAGEPIVANSSRDGGVLISLRHQGKPFYAHVRPNGAMSFAAQKGPGTKAFAMKFRPGALQTFDTKQVQTFDLVGVGNSISMVPTQPESGNLSRSAVFNKILKPSPMPSMAAAVASLTTIVTVTTPTTQTTLTIPTAPPAAGTTQGAGGGGGGGTQPNSTECLTSAFVGFSDVILGGATTVKTGAQVSAYLEEAYNGSTVDAAVILAMILGGGVAAVIIVGGLFALGVVAYAIYKDYKSCMAG